jgi:hypothetical protein
MYPGKFHTPENDLVVLPPDDVAQVKASEMSDPNRSNPNWTCAHCGVHFDDLKLREIVVEHLKSAYVLSQFYPLSLSIHPIYPGMGSTHLVSRKIYSCSDETSFCSLSRRATRLNLLVV